MEIPVYLFTGFLETGKTKFITETMNDVGFNDGVHKYLIITCEEGEEELTPDMFGENDICLLNILDESFIKVCIDSATADRSAEIYLFHCQ